MKDTDPVLIALPPELADEIIEIGVGRRKVSSQRSASTDVILLTIGTGGSVISLLQTPMTIRELIRLLHGYVSRHRAPLPLTSVGPGQLRSFTVSTSGDSSQLEGFLSQVLSQDLAAEVVVEVRSAAPEAAPAGWYHGQGDPEETVRYWDGSSWHGVPVPKPG